MKAKLEPIRTEADYEKTLSEIDKVFDAEEGTPEARLRDQLCKLIKDYEDEHYPSTLECIPSATSNADPRVIATMNTPT